jgi:hypothetical protein
MTRCPGCSGAVQVIDYAKSADSSLFGFKLDFLIDFHIFGVPIRLEAIQSRGNRAVASWGHLDMKAGKRGILYSPGTYWPDPLYVCV